MLPVSVQKEINDFFEDIRVYGYNAEFKEFSYSRGKRNYDNIIKKLTSINLPDPAELKFSTLSLEELVSILSEILIKLFGPAYKDRIQMYNSLLKLEKYENPFDAALESDFVHGEQTPTYIHISDKCQSIQIVSTAHEYVHCMLVKYDIKRYNEKINNIHYNELLSILIEYIVCYELSKILSSEKLPEKHALIRMHHDKAQALERTDCKLLIPQLGRLRPLDALAMKAYIEYQEHNSYSYILSNMYALHLLDTYKEDSAKIMGIVTAIIDGDQCINDLLSYFNLSLRNQDVITKYNAAVETASKTLHI